MDIWCLTFGGAILGFNFALFLVNGWMQAFSWGPVIGMASGVALIILRIFYR